MEQFRLWGTLVNAAAVIVGALLGLLIKQLLGKRTTYARMEQLSECIFHGIGLCVLAIGITGTVKAAVNDQIIAALAGSHVGSPENKLQLVSELAGERTLLIIISVVLGAILGHILNLDAGINVLGEKIERVVSSRFGNVAQGFVSASLLFCVGSMTVVGSLNSGLMGDHTMLYTKAVLDFVSALILATSLGIGVGFSAAFLLAFQGSITLLAQWIAPYLNNDVITCMSVIGSILIIGLAFNVLGMTKLKIMNYLPAIFLPALLIPLSDWMSGLF